MKRFIFSLPFITLLQCTFAQNNVDIIESNNRFSFDIFHKLGKTEKNLIFSPASITSAMAMTYIGAKDGTLDEISKTFYFNTDIDKFSKDYKTLINLNSDKKSSLKFYNANSLWIQKNLELNKNFLDLNKQYFSSSLCYTDFINTPEKSRLEINNWVEKNTNNKITNLLKPSSIDNATRLVLVNALYFKGTWKDKFDKEKNTENDFQIDRKKFVKTVFMNRYIDSWYYSDRFSQIIEIPYSSKNFSLMIILPKSYKKLKKIEKKLTYEYYNNYILNKEKKRINLSIPKFDIESEFDLKKTLSNLGIKEAFTNNANFSGITNSENLYISNVVHKANIAIDEEGTEAAAATAVIMRKTAMLLENVDFIVNKPFIYILRNNETNCIYFMGKITNPTKN